jgi:hypothetical protein
MLPGAVAGTDRQFDMDAAIIRLMALAANKRAHRPQPKDDEPQQIGELLKIRATPFRLCSIDDFPEPSPEWAKADRALKDFAGELADIGGVELMVDVYDEAVERHGYHAVSGVSASWDGCLGWQH